MDQPQMFLLQKMVTFNAFVFDKFLFDRVQVSTPRVLDYFFLYIRKKFLFNDFFVSILLTRHLKLMKRLLIN